MPRISNRWKSLWGKVRAFFESFSFRRSLKLRIFFLVLAVGVLPTIVLTTDMSRRMENRAVAQRSADAQTKLRILANHLILYGYFQNPDQPVIDAELSQFASFYDGRIMIIDTGLRVIQDTYGLAKDRVMISSDVVRCLKNGTAGTLARYDREGEFIEVVLPIVETSALERGDVSSRGSANAPEKIWGVLLVSVSTGAVSDLREEVTRTSRLLCLILWGLTIAAAFLIALILLRPFDRLSGEIAKVQAGFTTNPVRGDRYIETKRICDAFNGVLGRMRSLDESRQEFVSNVSHELKTPMTSMKVLADSLLQDPNTPVEMYREFLADIDEEIDRENRMISELLALARIDGKKVRMDITLVDIAHLLEVVMRRVRPMAKARDIELTLVVERSCGAEADEGKLIQLFTNLIENAVRYNVEHGKVIVTLNADHKNFVVSVEDTGIGIPKQDIGRIYERFYRVDKARSSRAGGTGLGLSIAKSAVLLHRGAIAVESTENVGTTFTVTIPLVYIPDQDPEEEEGGEPYGPVQ